MGRGPIEATRNTVAKKTEFQRLKAKYRKKHGKGPPPGTSTADLRKEFGRKKTVRKKKRSRSTSSRKSTNKGWKQLFFEGF